MPKNFDKIFAHVDRKLGEADELLRGDKFELAVQRAHSGDELAGFALMLLARASWSLRAVRGLFAGGNEIDAFSSLRTIAELLIDLKYVRTDPVRQLALFDGYVDVSNQRRFESLSQVLPSLTANDSPQQIAERKQKYDQAKANYPRPGQWSEKTIEARAKLGGAQAVYELVYRICCDATHSGPSTLQEVFEQGASRRMLSTEPPAPDSAFALALALFSFGWLLIEVREIFGEKTPTNDEFTQDLISAFQDAA